MIVIAHFGTSRAYTGNKQVVHVKIILPARLRQLPRIARHHCELLFAVRRPWREKHLPRGDTGSVRRRRLPVQELWQLLSWGVEVSPVHLTYFN